MALLIRGRALRVSWAWRFRPTSSEAQFVLDALSQWQFRPAVQNGQVEKVEVLLIIPEEDQDSNISLSEN
jgi:hypothetical protein